MSLLKFLKRSYLSYLSKPAGYRHLYRLAAKQPLRTIVQIGLTDLEQVKNMLWIAGQQSNQPPVRFVGVDQFEMRDPKQPPLALKDAHQALQGLARIKLTPGDAHAALARNANSLSDTDLLIFSAACDPESLSQAWFYVPRMLHPDSLVLRQVIEGDRLRYDRVTANEVDRLAVGGYDARRRAA